MLCAFNSELSSFRRFDFKITAHTAGATYDSILSDDRQFVAIIASKGGVYVIDLQKQPLHIELYQVSQTPGDTFLRAAFSPIKSEIAIGTEHGNVVFVNMRARPGEQSQLVLPNAHSRAVTCCSYSHDGKFLATGSAGGIVKVWDLSHSEPRVVTQSHVIFNDIHTANPSGVNGIHYLPDDSIVAAYTNGYLIQWTSITVRGEQKLRGRNIGGRGVGQGGGSWICDSTIALEKKIAVIACSDRTLKVLPLDGDGFSMIKSLAGHANQVTGCIFSDDQNCLLSYSRDRTLRIWSTRSWETLHILRGHTAPINSALFLPNGDVLSVAGNGEVFIWQLSGLIPHNCLLQRSFSGTAAQTVTAAS